MGFAGDAEATTCAGEVRVALLDGLETVNGNESCAGGGGTGALGAGNELVVGSQVTRLGEGVGVGEGTGVGVGPAGVGPPGPPFASVLELPPQPVATRANTKTIEKHTRRFNKFSGKEIDTNIAGSPQGKEKFNVLRSCRSCDAADCSQVGCGRRRTC